MVALNANAVSSKLFSFFYASLPLIWRRTSFSYRKPCVFPSGPKPCCVHCLCGQCSCYWRCFQNDPLWRRWCDDSRWSGVLHYPTLHGRLLQVRVVNLQPNLFGLLSLTKTCSQVALWKQAWCDKNVRGAQNPSAKNLGMGMRSANFSKFFSPGLLTTARERRTLRKSKVKQFPGIVSPLS